MQKLLICGGGNGTHVMVPVAARNLACDVVVYTPFDKEAALLNNRLEASGGICTSGALAIERFRPQLVTCDPARAAENVDMVIMVLPAFAHGRILTQLAPYLPERVKVGAMPSRSGFKYQAWRILTDLGPKEFTVFGLQTLPWACRLQEPGGEVQILGIKEGVGAAALPQSQTEPLCDLLGQMLGVNVYPYSNMLALSLANVGQIIHPGIMYGLFRHYNGEFFRQDQIPLFYGGVSGSTAAVLHELSSEVQLVKNELQCKLGPDISLDIPTVEEWLLQSYAGQIEDNSTLALAFRTNRAYKGLKAPMKRLDGKRYVPDFTSRYLVEDVPTGLLITAALGRLAGVATPAIDRVIAVTSGWMGKEYIKNGSLTGRDIAEARIPQNYGINDTVVLKELLLQGKLDTAHSNAIG